MGNKEDDGDRKSPQPRLRYALAKLLGGETQPETKAKSPEFDWGAVMGREAW